ncbi:recombinase family protein [Streptomyces sp. NPDC006798]|uniref:recombinase family protein n=1 Tax=Streptomyces sp. NPDC006798 TaxID=3155462 RepID=UPI0033DE80C6
MSQRDLIERAHWGNLEGMRMAGLVRLSFEVDITPIADMPGQRVPLTGYDIRGREEQEKDVREFVESRGGIYVYTYEEPDTSAWKRKRIRQPDGSIIYRVLRPVLEGAFGDLKIGKAPNGETLDGLIVYDIDRLTRDNRHLEDAIEVVENFKRPILDITGTLDLLTDNGRNVARVVVAGSNKSSANIARRVKRKHRAMKAAGLSTGGPRPTGWNADKRTLHPKEAKELKDAARKILEGASPFTIAAGWDRSGFTTPKGNRWTGYALKTILRNPRICGFSYRYVSTFDPLTDAENRRIEVVVDGDGKPVKGLWEPIISVEEWEALKVILGDNPKPGDGHNARKYLSTGTLRHDKEGCGARLRAMKAPKRAKKPEGFFYYVCPTRSSGVGCGGATIPGPETDEVVKKLVIAKYELEATRRSATQEPEPWSGELELTRLREDIEDWKEQRAERKIGKEAFFSFLAEAEVKERNLLRERATYLRKVKVSQSKPVDLAAIWEDLSIAEKRAYIERTLTTVLVAPAVGRGRPVRERLTPVYREEI